MERLLHRAGPAVPIFGSPRSQGTSYLWASGNAVKKRLLRRAGPAAAIFGLIMAVAHIGPTTLWIAVVKVAVALGIFAERWRCPAGQRWRPWSSRPRSSAASPDALSSLRLVSTTYILRSSPISWPNGTRSSATTGRTLPPPSSSPGTGGGRRGHGADRLLAHRAAQGPRQRTHRTQLSVCGGRDDQPRRRPVSSKLRAHP